MEKNPNLPSHLARLKIIVYEDKIIQTRNTTKIQCYPDNPDRYIANGEIGIVKGYDKGFRNLKVTFSDQPEYTYQYYDGESKQSVEFNLDLAYAITIHKSQGSDFDNVILVIPGKAHNISMEMMYTALTRFKEKTYLLIQGGSKHYRSTVKRAVQKRITEIHIYSRLLSEVKLKKFLMQKIEYI